MEDAANRKARLKALRAQAEAKRLESAPEVATETATADLRADEPQLKFRNYTLKDKKRVAHEQLNPAQPPEFVEPVSEPAIEAEVHSQRQSDGLLDFRAAACKCISITIVGLCTDLRIANLWLLNSYCMLLPGCRRCWRCGISLCSRLEKFRFITYSKINFRLVSSMPVLSVQCSCVSSETSAIGPSGQCCTTQSQLGSAERRGQEA